MKTSSLLLSGLFSTLGLGATLQQREPAANSAADVIAYAPFTAGGRTQYCGDTAVTTVTTSANSPLAADCGVLGNHFHPINGYFTLEIPASDDGNKWHPVARVGTCTFAIRVETGAEAVKIDVGSNDISFQTISSMILAKDGKLGAEGGVWCFAKGQHKDLYWGLVKLEEN
ncbi:hypothetical protein F5X68DRAFT_265056 [Plectosphaerella plurivora]|uniref:Ecp2 effector protein-like domain-containing protein n=1 Tax=Plectosphaerella plurivora TaxID=936078 RepID=A0A9P9A639_9PEZI|nr:hypothetical protein F5X68DRAFT_265056 [Plectosphaerella plurivora]